LSCADTTARCQPTSRAEAVITVLVLLGQVFELKAREQTSGAIRALLYLAPKRARRIGRDGIDEEVASMRWWRATACACGPAESVPVDGQVLEGRSTVDESMVTGGVAARPPRKPAPGRSAGPN